MDRIFAGLFLLVVAIIGFVRRAIRVYKISSSIELTNNYRNTFIDFINELFHKQSFNNETYYKLTSKVNEMQMELGEDGIFAYMQDPLRGISIKNYQLLINFLPKLRNFLSESSLGIGLMVEEYAREAGSCDDMFIRHIGSLETSRDKLRKRLLNPIDCFTYGIKTLLLIPIYLISSFGLLTTSIMHKISNSLFIRILAGIVAIIGFISSIVTIIIGWEQFIAIINNWLSRLN